MTPRKGSRTLAVQRLIESGDPAERSTRQTRMGVDEMEEPGLQHTLRCVPSLAVGIHPTPLHRLNGLTAYLGDGPQVMAKREDLCGVGLGGNKARKLAALLADAQRHSASVVLTTGAPQSNHCALTAIAAATRGLRTELYLRGADPGTRTGNLRVDELVAAKLVFLGECTGEERDDALAERVRDLTAAGETPYLIPMGGSNELGAAAYASVVAEIVGQSADLPVTHIVVAAGSLGTLAGLVIGSWLTDLRCEIHGYSVLWEEDEATARLDELVDRTRRAYFPDTRPRRNYLVTDSQLGPGYGEPTAAATEAIELAATLDGLILDGTYTGKAMAGLIEGARAGIYRAGHIVIFMHTGGLGTFLA